MTTAPGATANARGLDRTSLSILFFFGPSNFRTCHETCPTSSKTNSASERLSSASVPEYLAGLRSAARDVNVKTRSAPWDEGNGARPSKEKNPFFLKDSSNNYCIIRG